MTTDLTVVKAEVVAEESATASALAWLRSFTIASDADFDYAGDLVKSAKARWKELEEKRKSLTGPLRQTIKGIDDLFRPTLGALADAETILKGKIAGYIDAREAKRRATMEASAATYAAGGTPCLPVPEPATTAGVSAREAWVIESIDVAQLPREYLVPDMAAIKAAAPGPIPGVKFVRETRVAVRT